MCVKNESCVAADWTYNPSVFCHFHIMDRGGDNDRRPHCGVTRFELNRQCIKYSSMGIMI